MRLSTPFSIAIVAASVLTTACSTSSPAVSPTPLSSREGANATNGTGAPVAASLDTTTGSTHGHQLTALRGSGSGVVNVTPTAAVDGSFSAEITVNVHGAPPNRTFYLQRAPEIGRARGADGVCQRAAGLPPWGPPAPNFITFQSPAGGPFVALETSPGGAGVAHFAFAAPAIVDGTRFDVVFRLVDDLSNPGNDLRSECFTVTVR